MSRQLALLCLLALPTTFARAERAVDNAHTAASQGGAEDNAVVELSMGVRSLTKPKHRQKILNSRAAAEEEAKASCLTLLADRQDVSFYGFWASPEREQAKQFPDDIGRFSNRHADNSINCSRVSIEAGYMVTDQERLSVMETSPRSALFVGIVSAGLGFGALSDNLRLAPGEWAAISQVRMTCVPRPATERLILTRAHECSELQLRIDRMRNAEERRSLEASRPTYCDGILNAARALRATEFVRVGDEACVH